MAWVRVNDPENIRVVAFRSEPGVGRVPFWRVYSI
jgi:hypothetical protein